MNKTTRDLCAASCNIMVAVNSELVVVVSRHSKRNGGMSDMIILQKFNSEEGVCLLFPDRSLMRIREIKECSLEKDAVTVVFRYVQILDWGAHRTGVGTIRYNIKTSEQETVWKGD